MPTGQLSLKGRALRLLSGREYSRAELERKLAGREQQPGELRRVLDELQARGFIDHARVAVSVIHLRAGKLGTARIRQELQAKGLEPELVAQTLAGLRATEVQRARDIWRRRFEQLPEDAPERARQARFLAARGFDGDVIRRVLSRSQREDA